MGQFLVYAQNNGNTQAEAPSAPAIQGALQAAIGGQDTQCNITIGGAWVGAPRITRQAIANPFQAGRITRFAALFQYPDGGATDSAIQNCIKTLVQLQLALLGPNWADPQILPYDPNTNGSLDWWSSGQAAATHTQNAFDLNQQTGGTATLENPTGPQAATNPSNLNPFGSGLNPFANPTGDTSSLTMLAYVAIGGVALYFLWPLLMGARNVATAAIEGPTRPQLAGARNNPRRSARRRSYSVTRTIIG